MSNFLDAATSAVRNAGCQLLGVPTYINDTLQRLGFFPFDAARRAIPDFWRRALCDTDAPDPEPPPFTGGQCPTTYRVTVRRAFRQNTTGNQQNQTGLAAGNFLGPLRQERRQVGNNLVLFVIDGNGQETATFSVNNQTNTVLFLGIDGATRLDGQPDDCGDPEPEYDPVEPGDVTYETNITYDNSSGVSVTIPVVLIFARAQLTANANITIPFTLNLTPTLNVTGNLGLDGTVNFNFGGGNSTSLPKDPRKGDCGDIPLPDGEVPEDPTDSDKEPQKERDREVVLKGVLVTVNSLEGFRATQLMQNENPDIYVPNLGFVNFLVRVGEISGGWTGDIPVKNRRHLIECPWSDGAIDVKGTPQPGVTWTLTKVFGYAGTPVEYVQ